jgi:uncharacterized membrane protein YdjX (TVP38/TMEM64 family)
MKNYGRLAAAIAGLLLLSFIVFNNVMENSAQGVSGTNPFAPLLSIGLLTVDVFLPIPSSIVMTANGAVFGVIGGALVSLIGSMGGAIVAYTIGRRSNTWLQRHISPTEQATARAFLGRWGALAIICTRPVPILAETMMIMAGAAGMGWRPVLLASLVGTIPAAVLYAIAGASAAQTGQFLLIFGSVLLIGGMFWGIGQVWARKKPLSKM